MSNQLTGGLENFMPNPKVHELKTWPEMFWNSYHGIKNFEYRKNDRDFKRYDQLLLREYDPDRDVYGGQMLLVFVSYILYGPNFGIPAGYCVMSIQKVDDEHRSVWSHGHLLKVDK